MGRLIEVQNPFDLAANVTIEVGDVFVFDATGGQVRAGAQVVELLGSFLQAVVGGQGQIVAPMGGPNKVLFHARHPGRAKIDVMTGDPWRPPPTTTTLNITVAPHPDAP